MEAKPVYADTSERSKPWFPQFGDQVRIHVSPECPMSLLMHGDCPHNDGLEGKVVGIILAEPYLSNGHIYVVRAHPKYRMHFAAAELEPIGAALERQLSDA